ncbi:hypothetical protein CBL_06299 [Carabus blaptoides fortunei]
MKRRNATGARLRVKTGTPAFPKRDVFLDNCRLKNAIMSARTERVDALIHDLASKSRTGWFTFTAKRLCLMVRGWNTVDVERTQEWDEQQRVNLFHLSLARMRRTEL